MVYKCNVCNKDYSSYKSLWNHIKKYHNDNQQKINKNQHVNQHEINTIIPYNKLICNFCKKTFSFMQSRWRHEQKCKTKNDDNLKEELIKIKEELAIMQKKVETVQTTNINNGKINNNSNNVNIKQTNIVKFGSEDIINILNKSQVMKILNSRLMAIEESIKTVHFNNQLPEYQNIKINNLRSNIAMIHDGTVFNVVNQYGAIDELINNHLECIIQLIEDNKTKITKEGNPKLNPKTIERLEDLIEKMSDDDNKLFDESSNRKFNNYKDYKIDQVKNIIYNETNKIKKK